MNEKPFVLAVLLFCSPVVFAEQTGATFREGSGIFLSDETRTAIGLVVAEVEDVSLTPEFHALAQVFQNTNGIRAVASIPLEAVDRFEPVGAYLLRYDRMLTPKTGRVEALLELPDTEHHLIGDFVRIRFVGKEKKDSAAIPASAVLRTAYGDFAFVRNGNALLRTAIRTGVQQGDLVEILDGLYIGDEIAVTAVEALYLTELRATKGGGHSH